MIYLPKEIKDIVGNQSYTPNNVGMSKSEVLIYPEYVLKIQEHNQETDNEKAIVDWLNQCIPVPEIPVYCVEEKKAYTLMTKIKGNMLYAEEYLLNPQLLIKLVADAMKQLWEVDITKCPLETSRLKERLKQARWNVEQGLVDVDNVEPETFGKGGFSGLEELLDWLENNCPKEDLVLTHGDFCLPNVFGNGSKLSGFIDLGKMGPADRWQDIAIAIRSLKHNFEGKYYNGRIFYHFEPWMLLKELGIEMDEEKYRYYLLLDELF